MAERTFHNLGRLPVSFDLPVGRELLGSGENYGLNAQILSDTGSVRWKTPVPQSIDPTKGNLSATLMLQPNDVDSAGRFKSYKCANDFGFEMARTPKQAILRMGNRQISLNRDEAGGLSKPVYADEHGDQLAFGHAKITLTMDGATHINCVIRSGAKRSDSKKTNQ